MTKARRSESACQERPRAEFPRRAVRIHDIAEIEPLGGIVVERNLDPHGGIRPRGRASI